MGGSPGIQPEDEDEDERPDAAPEPEPDATRTDAEGDEPDDHEALDGDKDPVHRAHLPCSSISC